MRDILCLIGVFFMGYSVNYFVRFCDDKIHEDTMRKKFGRRLERYSEEKSKRFEDIVGFRGSFD